MFIGDAFAVESVVNKVLAPHEPEVHIEICLNELNDTEFIDGVDTGTFEEHDLDDFPPSGEDETVLNAIVDERNNAVGEGGFRKKCLINAVVAARHRGSFAFGNFLHTFSKFGGAHVRVEHGGNRLFHFREKGSSVGRKGWEGGEIALEDFVNGWRVVERREDTGEGVVS